MLKLLAPPMARLFPPLILYCFAVVLMSCLSFLRPAFLAVGVAVSLATG